MYLEEENEELILSLCKAVGYLGNRIEENLKRRKDDKEETNQTALTKSLQDKSVRKKRKLTPPKEALDVQASHIEQKTAQKILQKMRIVR